MLAAAKWQSQLNDGPAVYFPLYICSSVKSMLGSVGSSYGPEVGRSIKESCLDRLIRFGKKSLGEPPCTSSSSMDIGNVRTKGLGSQLLRPEPRQEGSTGALQRRERRGGWRNYYDRAAA